MKIGTADTIMDALEAVVYCSPWFSKTKYNTIPKKPAKPVYRKSFKGIRRNFFLKSIPLKELDEDELIAWEFLSEDLRKALDLKVKRIIGETEKEKLKGLGVKEVLVYRDLPRFGPFIFIGVVLALLLPDFFLSLLA